MVRFAVGSPHGALHGGGGPAASTEALWRRYRYARRATRDRATATTSHPTALRSPIPTTQRNNDDQLLRSIAADPQNLIIDGDVLKIESDGTTTHRYLSISAVGGRHKNADHSNPPQQTSVLTVADSRQTLGEEGKCLVIPFTTLADAFPVPAAYVGVGIRESLGTQCAANVFDIAFRNGKFRLRIQTATAEDNTRWVDALQSFVAITTAERGIDHLFDLSHF